MPRPTSKNELLEAATANFEKLFEFTEKMSEEELNTPFDFSALNKKEAHWVRDKNLRDVLAHLYEWHQLLLIWVNANTNGGNQPFLPEPYNWKTYGDMNIEFFEKHQSTDLQDIVEMLKKSHNDVIKLLESFTDEQLFTKSFYKWTGTTNLGSYFISVTSSHYDWALKKLRTHKKLTAERKNNGKA